MLVLTSLGLPPSPARLHTSERASARIGLVQHRWHPDPDLHRGALADGVRLAAEEGAQLVCLQELTLSPYVAIDAAGPAATGVVPMSRSMPAGPGPDHCGHPSDVVATHRAHAALVRMPARSFAGASVA